MNGIYSVPCPDGVEQDEHTQYLRRAFNTARGGNEGVEVDIIESCNGELRPARLMMPSVRETGEITTYDGFVARGFGIVRLRNEDIDPCRDARPMECYFNLKTGTVMVETLKKVGH